MVVNGTGTLNTTALTLVTSGFIGSTINPSSASLYGGVFSGPTFPNFSSYNGGGLTGPAAFGTGRAVTGSGTGSFAGIAGSSPQLLVPYLYTSGTALTDSVTFTGQTFASLGFTPGTHTYTWGTGADADSLTITGVGTGVPEPSTWAAVAAGMGLLGVVSLRRRGAAGAVVL